MALKLVIFDCDGVLVDSEGPTCDAIAANLQAYGFGISGADIHQRFVGGTVGQIGEEARREGATLPDDWVAQCYEDMYARLRQGVPVTAGVIELIDRLEGRGIAVGVASNGASEKMEITLGPSGLYARLAAMTLSGQECGAPKPQPGMIEVLMARVGATPDETLLVDDSPAGFGAAQAAGCRFVGYIEHGNHAKMAALGCDLAANMAEVAAFLG